MRLQLREKIKQKQELQRVKTRPYGTTRIKSKVRRKQKLPSQLFSPILLSLISANSQRIEGMSERKLLS